VIIVIDFDCDVNDMIFFKLAICIDNHRSMGSMHGGISGEGVRMLDNFRRS